MPKLRTGRVIRRSYIVAFLALCLALLVSSAHAQAPARLVAVGDVHGDYDAFVAILQKAGLIDAKLHWMGKNTTLVQTGDLLDRGSKCREVMDLLMALEVEAPLMGGRVITLLGNHEAMNIMGDLRYAEAMYAEFVDKSSVKRRQAAFDDFLDWQKSHAGLGGMVTQAGQASSAAEAAWYAAHPLGYVEQREAMSPSGSYGRWLRERPAVVKIGSTLFVHGGISADLKVGDELLLMNLKPEAIAEHVRTEVKAFDDAKQIFQQQKIILKTFNLFEIASAVHAELEIRSAELARKMAKAAKNTSDFRTPDPFETEKRRIKRLTDFLGFNTWFMVHSAGPLWYRGYATWNAAEGEAQVAKLLVGLGVSQIVVGHTPQPDGRIAARFDGKIFLIDTGMLSSYYNGGRASALEIVAGKFTAIYPDQSIVLYDPARTTAPTVPASQEERNSSELPGGGLDEEQQAPPQQQAPPPAAAAAAPAASPAAYVWLDADGKPLPFKTDEEVMEFLRTAKIVKMKDIPMGVAHPRKALLEKDGLSVNAKFSSIQEEKAVAMLQSGQRELNFRDDAIFDLAAQEVARMLGMDNLPPVVQRSVGGDKGIMQIWLENSMMEKDRLRDKLAPPNARHWNNQLQIMRIFDNLVYNTDRNQGNILIDKNWKVWLIDHTRAFRQNENLLNADALVEIDRGIWEKLLALDEQAIKDRLKPYLRRFELDGLIKRRRKIIEHYRAEIAKRGESDVVRDLK
jgi:hypothetical protein